VWFTERFLTEDFSVVYTEGTGHCRDIRLFDRSIDYKSRQANAFGLEHQWAEDHFDSWTWKSNGVQTWEDAWNKDNKDIPVVLTIWDDHCSMFTTTEARSSKKEILAIRVESIIPGLGNSAFSPVTFGRAELPTVARWRIVCSGLNMLKAGIKVPVCGEGASWNELKERTIVAEIGGGIADMQQSFYFSNILGL